MANLNVPYFQYHMKRLPQRRFFEYFQSLKLLLAQSRHESLLHKPTQTLDVVWIPFADYFSIPEVVNSTADIFFLSFTNLPFAVKIPIWLSKGF